MRSEIYRQPLYYDIAFSFVDAARSVDLLEAFIRKHSGVEVRTVLDICCGPALQSREFARRGYRTIGLDSSGPMLDYLLSRAEEEQVAVETIDADMLDFRLAEQVDFCYVMMGSIQYVGDNHGLVSHLSSVARALRPGGLYLIENLMMDWNLPAFDAPIVWDMERDGIRVRATYQAQLANVLEQMVHATLDLDVDDNGRRLRITDRDQVKVFFPQEFRTIVELGGQFDLVGFFERESTAPLRTISPDNIVVLRKR